jgi:anti-sigma regulatory factor (Ser/Thr protein kinase)
MSDPGSGHVQLELELPATPSSVGEARRAVTRLAREIGASEEYVALGVSEAVGNAVVHAYKEGEPGTVRVRATPEPGCLIVAVVDDGDGMALNLDSPGLGLGIPLMTRVTRDVRFDSSAHGTSVLMSFDIEPTDDPGQAS